MTNDEALLAKIKQWRELMVLQDRLQDYGVGLSPDACIVLIDTIIRLHQAMTASLDHIRPSVQAPEDKPSP